MAFEKYRITKLARKYCSVRTLRAPSSPKVIRAKIKVIAIGVCRSNGREFTHCSRLGTRQA